MKIVVAHPGKQHVNELLRVLQNQGWLNLFITTFASNKLPKEMSQFLGQKVHKRIFSEIPNEKVLHYPFLFLLSRLKKDEVGQQLIYHMFDKKVRQDLLSSEPNIVIAYENSNLYTFKAAKLKKVITILDLAAVHHNQLEKLRKEFPVYGSSSVSDKFFFARCKAKTAALKLTDYCFCLSTYARDTLVEAAFPANRIFVIPLGIDPKIFQKKNVYDTCSSKVFRLLYTGRITAAKGLLELFHAVKELALPNFELRLVGPPSPGENILNNLPAMVSYQPALPKEKLVEEYQKADAFVNFSYTDSWAQTVVEAMACGTPVIVSDNTGAKDAVRKGGGFIIPTGDSSMLKEKISYLYHNRNELERLGREAHAIAQKFTWNHYHAQLKAALEDIAQRENIKT